VSKLMADGIDSVLDHAKTVVIGNREPEFSNLAGRLRQDQVMVDLVRIGNQRSEKGKYEGICW
jgi:GDP-mannose 6-dehydrogenase